MVDSWPIKQGELEKLARQLSDFSATPREETTKLGIELYRDRLSVAGNEFALGRRDQLRVWLQVTGGEMVFAGEFGRFDDERQIGGIEASAEYTHQTNPLGVEIDIPDGEVEICVYRKNRDDQDWDQIAFLEEYMTRTWR